MPPAGSGYLHYLFTLSLKEYQAKGKPATYPPGNWQQYCAITGAELNTRGFVYFHGAAPEFEASVIKDSMGPNAWSFQDLCWQRKEDPAEMQLSRGYQHVCDELEVHHMLLC